MRDKYAKIGSDLTYYAGIDDLKNNTEEENVDWFEKRFLKTIVDPLEEVRKIGKKNTKIWDLNLGVVTLICCAIEALSNFHAPQVKTNKAKFVGFVEEFMYSNYRKESGSSGKKYSEILYEKYRCGLAHGLTIEGHEVATRPKEYLKDINGYVSIDLWTLFKDLKNAFHKYLKVVRRDNRVRSKFILRFNEIFIRPY
jgi:hypothetical protein